MADRPLQAETDTVRLPLYSDDSQRLYQADTSIPVVTDAMLINCWGKKTQAGQGYEVIKRSGIGYQSGNTDNGGLSGYTVGLMGMQAVGGTFIQAIWDGSNSINIIQNYGPMPGTVILLGTIPLVGGAPAYSIGYNGAGPIVHMTEGNLAGVPQLLISVHGVVTTITGISGTSCGWYAAATDTATLGTAFPLFTAGGLTQIADVDFPANIAGESITGPFVQLKTNMFIQGKSGKVYNSDDGSVTAWNSFGVQPAGLEPDTGVGLCKYKEHLIAFGENSLEFFEYAGLKPPGGPLSPLQQAFIKIGCNSSQSFINIDDTVYWISTGANSVQGMWKLENYIPQKLSKPEHAVFFNPTSRCIRLASISFGGQNHIAINRIILDASSTGHYIASGIASVSNATESGTYGEATEVDATHPITAQDSRTNTMMYSIDDNSWWWFSSGIIDLAQIYASRRYGKDTDESYQVVSVTTDIISAPDLVEPCFVHQLFDPNPLHLSWTDFNAAGTEQTSGPVYCAIQLAPIEFATEKMKFMHKLKLICDYMTPYTGDTSVGYKFYVTFQRADMATLASRKQWTRNRGIAANRYRYVWAMVGPFRKLSILFEFKTKMPFRGHCIEVDVTQGLD